MTKEQHAGHGQILEQYEREVSIVAKSVAGALNKVGTGGAAGSDHARQFLLHSAANAFGALQKSVAAALRDVGGRPEESFKTNAETFRRDLAGKVQQFLALAGKR